MRFLRLGHAGMRGEVGSGLTPELAIDYASALGTYLDGGRVVVGRDSRISSNMLYHAVSSALISAGCEVIDAALCPAPLLQFLVPHLKADGGMLLGAGHHPAGWNAIVPLAANGAYLNSIQNQELLDIYHSHNLLNCPWDKVGTEEPVPKTAVTAYLDHLGKHFNLKAIGQAKFKVVVDFCNGTGPILAGGFQERMGIEIIPVNDQPSGILPHDPEPRPRSGIQVQSLVKHLQADVGFVFNSDMSRVAMVMNDGETLSEEYTFPLFADHALGRLGKPATAVTNWCTTRTLDDVVSRHGGTLDKAKVGQAFIIDRMQEMEALIAGDGSGSVALHGIGPAFDSYAAMAMILEAMALRQSSSSELMAGLPRYHIVKRKVDCPSAHAYTLLRRLRDHFPEASLSEEDGFRFDWQDGWIHLRAAMTEPIIRMIVEWKTPEEAEERALELRGLLERLVAS